jgi:hypothetical protein
MPALKNAGSDERRFRTLQRPGRIRCASRIQPKSCLGRGATNASVSLFPQYRRGTVGAAADCGLLSGNATRHREGSYPFACDTGSFAAKIARARDLRHHANRACGCRTGTMGPKSFGAPGRPGDADRSCRHIRRSRQLRAGAARGIISCDIRRTEEPVFRESPTKKCKTPDHSGCAPRTVWLVWFQILILRSRCRAGTTCPFMESAAERTTIERKPVQITPSVRQPH